MQRRPALGCDCAWFSQMSGRCCGCDSASSAADDRCHVQSASMRRPCPQQAAKGQWQRRLPARFERSQRQEVLLTLLYRLERIDAKWCSQRSSSPFLPAGSPYSLGSGPCSRPGPIAVPTGRRRQLWQKCILSVVRAAKVPPGQIVNALTRSASVVGAHAGGTLDKREG